MTEADLLRQIRDYLILRDCLVMRVNSGAVKAKDRNNRQRYFNFIRWATKGRTWRSKGVADLVGCTPGGKFFAIEVKRPGNLGKTSQHQADYLNAADTRGAIALAVDSLEAVMEVL